MTAKLNIADLASASRRAANRTESRELLLDSEERGIGECSEAQRYDCVSCVSNLANNGARGFALRQRLHRKTRHCQHKKSKVRCPGHEYPTICLKSAMCPWSDLLTSDYLIQLTTVNTNEQGRKGRLSNLGDCVRAGAKRKLCLRTCSQRRGPEVLVLYLKRPRAKSWELRRCGGALQIQRLEGSRPGDYGICIWMRRS